MRKNPLMIKGAQKTIRD